MAVLPITRVSVGDSLNVPNPTVSNAAIQIKPLGISNPIGNGVVVHDVTITSAAINLNLSTAVIYQAGSSVRFTFNGAILQPKTTLGIQTAFGNTLVKKGADLISPKGFNSAGVGISLVIPQGFSKQDFNLNAVSPSSSGQNISFHFGPIVISNVGLQDSFSSGNAVLVNAINIRSIGIIPNSDKINYHFIYEENQQQHLIDFNLQNLLVNSTRFNFGGANPITQAGGIYQSSVSEPSLENTSDAINPKSINPNKLGLPLLYPATGASDNTKYGVLNFNLDRQVQPQNALNIPFSFFGDIQLSTIGWQSSEVGFTLVQNQKTFITTDSWQSSAISTAHSVTNSLAIIQPTSIVSAAEYGRASLINGAVGVAVNGIASPAFNAPTIYNLKQFVRLQSNDQSRYGNAYLKGGVKYLLPLGIYSTVLGIPETVKYIGPTGIASPYMPAPSVSPRMVRPLGLLSLAMGSHNIRIPAISPKGIIHSSYGTATVWYHTRLLSANGINAYESGYPKVFDPTQFIQQSPMVRTAVFGDTYAKNKQSSLSVKSIDDMVVSQWTSIINKSRPILPKGWLSQAIGDQAIKNKSPSIFFKGIEPPKVNEPALGYRSRAVGPSGFDHLLLGNPALIKTPQLFPNGLVATQFGNQWVSNSTRHIASNGLEQSRISQPTVWYRYRGVAPQSWRSSVVGMASTVTHGVREIIGHGFIQKAYGIAWVSHGTRLLEAQSIYQDYLSSHFVGRHQEIKPYGYIATLFGTRITPESLSIYPLGFVGEFGLSVVGLYKRHIKPVGYASAGTEDANRWGKPKAYNSVQYIQQDYAGDNGLVPPAWSDWTAIENRNKTIGTIGSNSQKFGYLYISNNATQLFVKGIVPPAVSRNDISYRIRSLPVDGIEAPYLGNWAVVHNAARVLGAVGIVPPVISEPALNNNRRYYRGVGRIESQEFGKPMIAYRVRVIDIETRYSISPPIIRLPTIDLWTRYVSFNGFETSAYGSPSLSIHLRVISPRWTHREKSGSPALRNVTPELLTRGRDSSEFGVTSIRTQWRDVYAQGDNTSLFGGTKISDTKQSIQVHGWLDSISSQNHNIRKTGTNPYVTQNVWLNDESGANNGQGFGIFFDENLYGIRIPLPSLNQNVLYPVSEEASSRIGNAFVWSNNIVIDSGIGIDGVSGELSVRNTRQVIILTDKHVIDSETVVGKPRMSPHTIWAVVEAPQQAIDNHVKNGLHYVGASNGYPAGARLGTPSIESAIRNLNPYWRLDLSGYGVGQPSLYLKRSVVKPSSFRSSRLGVPAIPFTPQDITLRSGIYDSVFGLTGLSRPPYLGPQAILVKGFNSNAFGLAYSDNFIRTLDTIGQDSLSMGRSLSGDKPFMWQGLRIGEHVPSSIGVGDTSLFGESTISLYVRGVTAEGFNAFISGYDLSSFDDRMTVKNNNSGLPPARNISNQGFASSMIGSSEIKLGQHFIKPDGNSNQFRKGGYHA